MKTDKLLKNIKNLLDMSKDTSSPEEAMIAARLARKLMDKHQVEELDLKNVDPSDFGNSIYDTGMKNKLKTISILAVCIAKYNDCQGSNIDSNILFRGFKADTDLAVTMMSYIVKIMYDTCKKLKLTRKQGTDYRQGFAVGISEQIKETLQERVKIVTSTGTNLVFCKNQLVTQKFGKVSYSKVGVKYTDDNSFKTGKLVGKNISLTKPKNIQAQKKLS